MLKSRREVEVDGERGKDTGEQHMQKPEAEQNLTLRKNGKRSPKGEDDG